MYQRFNVMAGLVPAIHAFDLPAFSTIFWRNVAIAWELGDVNLCLYGARSLSPPFRDVQRVWLRRRALPQSSRGRL